MRYWWVSQNQTYRHEVQGGYLWSPKRNANGARSRAGRPDLFFHEPRILAIGIAQSYCWESPKPIEFGNSGQNWEDIGWRVKVNFTELNNKVRPKDHIDILRGCLKSPGRSNTHGTRTRVRASCLEAGMGKHSR